MTAGGDTRTDILVVGWYPAADAITSGRFVADQATALAATGRVRPTVVAFDNAVVRGPAALREREAGAIATNRAAALGRTTPFVIGGAAGAPHIPVARLTVAAGSTPSSGPDHRAIHRVAALGALLDTTRGAPWSLVHGHVGYPEGAAAAHAAARLGVPLVITEHASFLDSLLAEPVVREGYRRTLLAASRVIAVSRMLANEVIAIVPEVRDRLVVIPNAVDVDAFVPGHEADRVRGELLWVGGRPASKGIELLLRAFAVVRAQRPDAVLRLCGPAGPAADEAAWHRLAGQLGIADALRFVAPTGRPAVAAAMARADLFVHPSPRETFGIVAAEALATGLPVVTSDSGGVTEILGERPERYGAIVPVGDPEAFARAILATLDRRATFDPARLRAHVVERYAADRVAGQLVELYDGVLERAKPRAGAGAGAAAANWADPPDRGRRTIVLGVSRLELEQARGRFPATLFRDVAAVSATGLVKDPGPWHPTRADRAVADLLQWGMPAPDRPGLVSRLARRLHRRLGRGPDPEPIIAALTAALERELTSSSAGDVPLLVPLGGLDHLVAAPFDRSGRVTVAPGGLRWLADVRLTTAARVAAAAAKPDQPPSDA